MFAAQYARASPGYETMLDVLRFIEPHRACYVQLHTAFQIACTIPDEAYFGKCSYNYNIYNTTSVKKKLIQLIKFQTHAFILAH